MPNPQPPHTHPDEAELDETLEESFPASDPPANPPEPGERPEPPADERPKPELP